MRNVFNSKNIIVTGGASGIGAELVKQLTILGANVAVIGRSAEYNGTSFYVKADMSDFEQANNAYKTIVNRFGDIDYMINNAGIFMGGEIRDTPNDNWHAVIDNNIYAISHGSEIAYKSMLKKKSGHIVNVASTAGLIPVPAMGIYGASKYALVGLSHALRNEAQALGVKVSVACPTIVDTPLYDTAFYNQLNKKRLLKNRNKLQTPEAAARKILKGIVKNKATIHTSFATHFIWVVYRLMPGLYNVIARGIIKTYRKSVRTIP